MIIKVNLIRHGKTNGNLLKQYIGTTDEPLSDKGISELSENSYPEAETVFSSPMLRCIQTAEIIYPKHIIRISEGLREYDFGEFEGKTYEELKDNPRYREWISGGGEVVGAESTEEFKIRCFQAFREAMILCEQENSRNVSVICHGGTIMSVLDKVSDKGFYEWQSKNGEGFILRYDTQTGMAKGIGCLF